jgi:MFS family permease
MLYPSGSGESTSRCLELGLQRAQVGAWIPAIFPACLLGIAAGPFLGAVLAQAASWRWVFWMMAPSTSGSLQSPDDSRISYHCLDTLYRAPKTVGGKLIAKDQTDGLARNCAQSFHVGVHTGEFAQCSRADG